MQDCYVDFSLTLNQNRRSLFNTKKAVTRGKTDEGDIYFHVQGIFTEQKQGLQEMYMWSSGSANASQ